MNSLVGWLLRISGHVFVHSDKYETNFSHNLITSTREVILLLSICMSVYCLFCLLAALLKKYWTDFHENFTTDVSGDKKELIEFLNLSASES